MYQWNYRTTEKENNNAAATTTRATMQEPQNNNNKALNKNWLQISIKWSLALSSPFNAFKLDWKKAKWSLEKSPLRLSCCCCCCSCRRCCCCCCSCRCYCRCCSWWSILHNNKFSNRSGIICIKYVTEKKLACCNDMKVALDRWKMFDWHHWSWLVRKRLVPNSSTFQLVDCRVEPQKKTSRSSRPIASRYNSKTYRHFHLKT